MDSKTFGDVGEFILNTESDKDDLIFAMYNRITTTRLLLMFAAALASFAVAADDRSTGTCFGFRSGGD